AEVELTWDASSSLPAGLDSYHIFYKLKTEAQYPSTPQFIITDTLPSYSQRIPLNPDTGYDFKIFAYAVSGLASTEDCESCETTNALCGNEWIEPGENCDGADSIELSCSDFDYLSGELVCSSSCQFDFFPCAPSPTPLSTSPDSVATSFRPSCGGGCGGASGLLSCPATSRTAISPEFTSFSPILITYTWAKSLYSKQLSQVHLYYKKNGGA